MNGNLSLHDSSPKTLKSSFIVKKTSKQNDKKRLSLVERNRPKTLEEVHGQASAVKTLEGFVQMRAFSNLILSGTSGVGKTSSAFAFLNDFFANLGIANYRPLLLSLNASQDNGIETIRKKIMPFAESGSSFLDAGTALPKVVLLDEADAMTKQAQWALGPIMDATADRVRYIFIVNYQRKIQSSLQSRCQVLRFPPLPQHHVVQLIKQVCQKEKIHFTHKAHVAAATVAQNDMRMALNVLSSCGAAKSTGRNQPIGEKTVYELACRVPPAVTEELVQNLFHKEKQLGLADFAGLVDKHFVDTQVSLLQFLNDLHDVVFKQSLQSSQKNPLSESALCAIFMLINKTQVAIGNVTDTQRLLLHRRALASALWKIKSNI